MRIGGFVGEEIRIRVGRAWLPRGFADDVFVALRDGRVTELRPGHPTDGRITAGTLFPGFVNAHVHLEIDRPVVPGGAGLPAWVGALRGRGYPAGDGVDNALEARGFGTALVCDVSNGGHTQPALRAAGLAGLVQHELLGFGRATLADRIALAGAGDVVRGEVVVRPSPHGTYSTHPELLRAAARPSQVPGTIHLGEDPAERRFLTHGDGPFAELLDGFGVDWRHFAAPGCGPVEWLDRLGVLGPDLLLVHGVDLDAADRARIARRGAAVCLCPRSNLHVGGVLPDVAALVEAGIPLAIGTDSLGSTPDLDVLAEIVTLRERFPTVPEDVFWHAGTAGGAEALARPGFGHLTVGATPRPVLVEGLLQPGARRQNLA